MNQRIKKLSALLIILLFLLLPVAFADDGDYTIPEATVDVKLSDDGSVYVIESITQDIEGSINGIYRDIQLDSSQNISDIHVITPGYYNKVQVIREDTNLRIKVWLYKNPEKTQKLHNDEVKIIYKYKYNNVVKNHNDIVELQMKTWGNNWDSRADKLTTYITIPDNSSVQYWNNPSDNVQTSKWINNTTLKTQLTDVPAHSYFEQRLIMPKDSFKINDNFISTGLNAKDKIIHDQEKYASDREFQKTLGTIVNSLLAVLLFIPLAVYTFFGREPKIEYKSDYEYDTPTDDSPLFVNNVVIGDVGEFDVNAYNASILNLIENKYFTIVASNDNDTIIRKTNKDTSGLKKYEKDIINFLSRFEKNNDISFNYIKNFCEPTEYTNFISNWKETAKSEISQQKLDSYFDSKGSDVLKIISAFMLVISVILFIYVMFTDSTFFNIIIIVLMFIIGLMSIFIPNTFAGRWTPEGKTFHDKWVAFKNYITDYSMIKDYPPASIQVWGRYMVYATALGCAKQVSNNMFKYFDSVNLPEDNLYQSDIVWFVYYNGLDNMSTSFSHLEAEANASSSDGISSVGGGFGGGGGGTF